MGGSQHHPIKCPTNMSAQVSLWRIYFRCQIHTFSPALRFSISHSGRSRGLIFCHEGIRGITVSSQYRAFSSKGLRTEGPGKPTAGGQQSENLTKPEEGQRSRHAPLVVDSIANLDAMSFLASSGSREKKFVETREAEDPLLMAGAEKADQQFLKNYKLLLSDTNYDLEMGLQDLEDSKWMPEDSKGQSGGFKRMPVTGNHKLVGQITVREPLSCIFSHHR